MRYFTPELLRLFGSPDETVAANAHEALEQASEGYEAHLQTIRSLLPESLRLLLDQHYLHDARVLLALAGETDSGKGFVFWLRLDTPPHEELILNYRLVKKPQITEHPKLLDEASLSIEWLHDEVEMLSEGQSGVVRQSILLSNGWEIDLHFDAMNLTRISEPLFSTAKHQSELASKP